MLTAAEIYAARVDAVRDQQMRLRPAREGDRWASRASLFRLDPHRKLDANATRILSLLQPLDAVIDIGGGAGRLGLPAALRCSEVINLEPSAAMRQQFEESAAEAGITNTSALGVTWPDESAPHSADVVITSNVTYFVRDILPFLEAMDRAAERLCAITVWSVPPPDRSSDVFELVFGEPQEPTPTHLELLAALWELDILPDVTVLPDPFTGFRSTFGSREEAIGYALEMVSASDLPGARERVEAEFDNLFAPAANGFDATWYRDSTEMLITWAPRSATARAERGG